MFTELFCRYKDKLDRCDVLLLPHHGTDRSGEALCFYAVNPEVCVVSSNPAGHDGLPMEVARRLSFTPFLDRISYTYEHKFSFFDGVPKSIETLKPLFVTCDSSEDLNYYKLTIDFEGNMIFRDGDNPIKFISLLHILPIKISTILQDMYKKFEKSTFKPTGEPQHLFFADFPYELSKRFSGIIRKYRYNYSAFMYQFFPPKVGHNTNNWDSFLRCHVFFK